MHVSGLPPPPGHSPWPSLPPPVINHGREPDRNGDAPDRAADATMAPIERVVLPADQSAATVVVVDPVSPIDKLERASVPRIAPSPDGIDEVGQVVITPVDAATPPTTGSAPSSSRSKRSTRSVVGEPRWRRPLLLGFAALALIGVLALLATLARSNNDKTESIAATTVVATAPTTAAAPTSTATTVATTAVLPRTTSPSTVAPTTVATIAAPTTVVTTAAPTTTEVPAPAIPAPNIYDGRANKTIKVAMPGEQGPVLMYLTHTGKRSFIVKGLDAKGKPLFTAVNTIGAFTGSVLVDDVTSVQIVADGAWHVELRSVLSARQFANTVAGTGPEVLVYTGNAGTATILHDGTKDFRVEVRTTAGPSELVKTTGAFNGTAPMPAGFAIVAITADGPWNVTVA
jgi:hypothetical protein